MTTASHAPVSQEAFHAHLRAEERRANAGSTTSYDDTQDLTHWLIAGNCVGLTRGRIGASREYLLPA